MLHLVRHPTFARSLLDYITDQIASGPQEWGESIQQYLVGQSDWDTTSSVVNEEIHNTSSWSLLLRDLLAEHMRCWNTNAETLYAPILLTWGLQQPWRDEINVAMYLHRWAQANMPEHEMMSSQHTACAFLDQFVSVAKATTVGDHVYVDLAACMLDRSHSWNPSLISSHELSSLAVLLGQAACKDPKDKMLAKDWVLYVGKMFERSSLPTQLVLSRSILQSKLPDNYKLIAHQSASPLVWSDSHNALRPLLPAEPMACFTSLPWRTLNGDGATPTYWRTKQFAEENSKLFKTYFPLVFTSRSADFSDDDWCHPHRLATLLEQSSMAQV